MAADDAYMTFHGLRVHIKVVEPEKDIERRVFMLSSPLTSTFNWRKITPELSQTGCLIVMMDLPGFGRSACGEGVPQDTRLRSNVAWGVLDEIDAALGDPPSAWHLIGHGEACQTVIDMANMYPDAVNSQVYISPFLDGEDKLRLGKVNRGRWFTENILSKRGWLEFMDGLFARRADDYILDAMREPFLREGARASFLMMLAQRTRPVPVKGFAPVLALWGDRDYLMDDRAREALRRLAPEAETHILKTAGHIPMETHSHALRDYLRGWFKYTG